MYIRKHVFRFSFIFLALIITLLGFTVKLVLIQVFRSSHLAKLAAKQHNHFIEIEPIRGSIYDRNNRVLAFNVPAYSLFCNPRMMTKENKVKAIKHLSFLLELDPQYLEGRFNRNKYFVWLKRKITPQLADKIKALKIKGLDFRKESKRYYPNGVIASHLIGFSGIDNRGLEGLELYHDKVLRGESGWMRVLRDARQQDLMLTDGFVAPKHGAHVILTIDETIQSIAERALEKTLIKKNADAATIIVMDVRTGEILALANRPTYNLDFVHESSLASRTNRAISFVYEPGSVFKIVTAAAALEEEVFTETDEIFCENGEYRVGNHILHDHKPHGTLTFKEVFGLSSNIGVTKIAQKIGPDVVYKYAKRFRFGIKTDVDLFGEVRGVLRKPSLWSKTSIGAIPIGHEILVTPLQLVAAVSAVANGGVFMQPFVVKEIRGADGRVIKTVSPRIVDRVISEDTARRVTEILVGVVENGTARRARIKDVRVAGKTGTAQKVVNGTYSHSQFYASFMGFAPADNPRLAAVVVYDEPRPDHYGGTVAAPVFKEVIENSLRYFESDE